MYAVNVSVQRIYGPTSSRSLLVLFDAPRLGNIVGLAANRIAASELYAELEPGDVVSGELRVMTLDNLTPIATLPFNVTRQPDGELVYLHLT